MPYVVRVDQHGKEVKEDRYYTSRWKKEKARQEGAEHDGRRKKESSFT